MSRAAPTRPSAEARGEDLTQRETFELEPLEDEEVLEVEADEEV